LTGHITDNKGKPIAKATIDIVNSRKQANSDLNGQFEIDVDSTSVNEIHIKAKGYSHRILHLHGQQTTHLTVQLQPSAIEHVDVIGLPLHASTMESAQPISVIRGEDLRSKQAGTLGETLKNEVGVHSSYFGPVASSPIIRGLNGPRVLITQNGLDVSDASRVGPDHVPRLQPQNRSKSCVARRLCSTVLAPLVVWSISSMTECPPPANPRLHSHWVTTPWPMKTIFHWRTPAVTTSSPFMLTASGVMAVTTKYPASPYWKRLNNMS
jgi:hypothetical protein